MRKILLFIVCSCLLFMLTGCGSNENNETNETNEIELNYTLKDNIYTIENKKYIESEESTNLVKIDVKDTGIIIAELYPKTTPITVKNFKKLVSEEFYDGIIFHRVIYNFMIQTGDPEGTGAGGSDKEITGEFRLNGIENDLSHTRGVLSMARRGSNPETEETMNSASSQFFIVHADSTYLDGNYAAFGKVLHGLDVVDKIAMTETDYYDKPINDIIMTSIRFVEEVDNNE